MSKEFATIDQYFLKSIFQNGSILINLFESLIILVVIV